MVSEDTSHNHEKGGVDCGREGYILGGSHKDAYSIAYSCLKGGTFCEGGVDSRRIAYIYILKWGGGYVTGGRVRFWERRIYSKPSGEGKIHIICLVACATFRNLVNIVLSAGSI